MQNRNKHELLDMIVERLPPSDERQKRSRTSR